MPHDVQFHRLIVEGSGNRTLIDLWTSLHVEARTMITFVRYGDLHYIAESHVPILDALRARDAELHAAALREHFEYYARGSRTDPGRPAAGRVKPPSRSSTPEPRSRRARRAGSARAPRGTRA